MENNNENKDLEITQGTEPSIEVDTVAETVSDEVAASEVVEDTKDSGSEVEESVEAEASDEPEKEATDEADKSEDETVEKPEEKAEDEGKEEDKEVPPAETPEESSDNAASDDDKKEDEVSQEDKDKLELEALRLEKEDNEIAQDFLKTMDDVDKQMADVESKVKSSIEAIAKRYDIPTDITMEELEKRDPVKAQMAKDIMARANDIINNVNAQLTEVRESKAREVVFKKAEREFKKYELSPEQVGIAADTFIRIINQSGVQDLGEDIKAKVKLAVAQARMDSPIAAAIADVAQEVLDETKPIDEVKVDDTKVEDSDTTVLEEPSPEKSEETEEISEEKSEVTPSPDISEFKEGVTGQATKAQAITVDNVLVKLNALPFKERTAFYKENVDLINQAMTKRRMAE